MSEINSVRAEWHTPALVAIGKRDVASIPATIDLAEDGRVVDLSDRSAKGARKP